MIKLISQCWFSCSQCLAYTDNITSRQHQQQVHDILKMYIDVNIPSEEITCPGCHTGDRGDRVLSVPVSQEECAATVRTAPNIPVPYGNAGCRQLRESYGSSGTGFLTNFS